MQQNQILAPLYRDLKPALEAPLDTPVEISQGLLTVALDGCRDAQLHESTLITGSKIYPLAHAGKGGGDGVEDFRALEG